MTENGPDILALDNQIKSRFQEERKKLPILRRRLCELEKTLSSISSSSSQEEDTNAVRHSFGNTRPLVSAPREPITTPYNEKPPPVHVSNSLEKNISELRENISRIENNRDINFYTAETIELIERYNAILKTPLKISFMGKNKKDKNNPEKKEIVEKYMEIAHKYYPENLDNLDKLDNSDKKPERMVCDNCANKKDFYIEENAYICALCGSQQEMQQYTTSYKDADRVNISAKYTYDRKVHFRDCMNQYQGKQNCSIDSKVYTDLEEIFDKHHLLKGNKGDKKEIRFANITKEHILMFLKELGYSKHYENVILIHYTLTGKKPDDISHLEDKLMADFDLLVETYDKHFKNKVDRVNFISTQYVLYQLLQKHKHPCRKEDFVILKTIDRKTFHDEVMNELFSYLGWGYFRPVIG
jgi:hypothetical protein